MTLQCPKQELEKYTIDGTDALGVAEAELEFVAGN